MTQKNLTARQAKAVADTIRGTHPQKAAEIDAKIAGLPMDDTCGISVAVNYRIEKFHGDMKSGDTPYEVIEGRG